MIERPIGFVTAEMLDDTVRAVRWLNARAEEGPLPTALMRWLTAAEIAVAHRVSADVFRGAQPPEAASTAPEEGSG